MDTQTSTVVIDRIRFDQEIYNTDWPHRLWRFDICISESDESPSMERVYANSPFMCGMALDEPTPADILESLAMDLQSIEPYTDWLDWAEDLDGLTSAKAARESRENFGKIETMRALFTEYGVDVAAFIAEHVEH
jgi:hypothetical protein